MEQQPPEDNNGTPSIADNKKRARVDDSDSDSDSAVSKLARVDSDHFDVYPSPLDVDSAEPGFDSDNSGVNSPEAKRIQDELLSVLDDSDEPPVQGLDSVIKSFEEEILPATVGMASLTGDSQPDLGYLLEASDDELGLPPTFSSDKTSVDGEDGGAGGSSTGLGDIYGGFDNEVLVGYDSFELGLGEGNKSYNDGEGFVALGGLFDYPDESFVSGDMGLQWKTESLPAL